MCRFEELYKRKEVTDMGKRYLVLLLAISIFLNVPMKINAAEIMEYNSDMQVLSKSIVSGIRTGSGDRCLFDCELAIGIAKNGLGVEFTTRCSTDATEIGIKDAVLQEKTLLGWKDIPIKDYCDYDQRIYVGAVVYIKAEAGRTYRVSCTHYAIVDDVELTLYNYTDEIVFN